MRLEPVDVLATALAERRGFTHVIHRGGQDFSSGHFCGSWAEALRPRRNRARRRIPSEPVPPAPDVAMANPRMNSAGHEMYESAPQQTSLHGNSVSKNSPIGTRDAAVTQAAASTANVCGLLTMLLRSRRNKLTRLIASEAVPTAPPDTSIKPTAKTAGQLNRPPKPNPRDQAWRFIDDHHANRDEGHGGCPSCHLVRSPHHLEEIGSWIVNLRTTCRCCR